MDRHDQKGARHLTPRLRALLLLPTRGDHGRDQGLRQCHQNPVTWTDGAQVDLQVRLRIWLCTVEVVKNPMVIKSILSGSTL